MYSVTLKRLSSNNFTISAVVDIYNDTGSLIFGFIHSAFPLRLDHVAIKNISYI